MPKRSVTEAAVIEPGKTRSVAEHESLSYTNQLRDFAASAKQEGLSFNLYVRGGGQPDGAVWAALGRCVESIHLTYRSTEPAALSHRAAKYQSRCQAMRVTIAGRRRRATRLRGFGRSPFHLGLRVGSGVSKPVRRSRRAPWTTGPSPASHRGPSRPARAGSRCDPGSGTCLGRSRHKEKRVNPFVQRGPAR